MWEKVLVFFSRLTGIARHNRADIEFDAEIAEHLELLAADNIRRGMSPPEARMAARRSFGGVTQVKESQRELRGLPQFEVLWTDCRYAARVLRKNPGFTLVAAITLALGIGINTTLFTAYNAIALKPLPVADPPHTVRFERWFQRSSLGNLQYAFSYPEFQYFRGNAKALVSLCASSFPFVVSGEAERLRGHLVSGNYFQALGIRPALGRAFLPEEDGAPGAHPVVVLAYEYWQRRYQADPLVLGQTLKLNGRAYSVVGVAAKDFPGTAVPAHVPDFWAPIAMQAELAPGQDWLNDPNALEFVVMGRFPPGVTLTAAQAEAVVLMRQFSSSHIERQPTATVTLQHMTYLGNTEDPRFQEFIAALMVLVGLIWLIACANLANMQLARTAVRQRELAIRLSMGAARGRIVRQLLTESTLLALMGGAGGLLFSSWSAQVLWTAVQPMLFGPGSGVSVGLSFAPDIRIFGYAFLLALATGIAFGLSPALRFSRPDLTVALKEEGATIGGRLARSRMRSLLIGGQVTASMLLLVIAGLLVRGMLRSRDVRPGFEARGVYIVSADFGRDPARAAALQQRMLEKLAALPELRNVSLGDSPMMGTWTPPIVADGRSGRTLGSYASPGYFETLSIPLVRGREFTPAEVDRESPVAVISESAARQFWPSEDPMGRHFKLDMDFNGKFQEFEVVGIAHDIRYANLSRTDPAHVYLPTNRTQLWQMMARAQGDPQSAAAAVRRATSSLDPNLLHGLGFIGLEDGPLRMQHLMAETFAMFAVGLAVLALSLAGVGIYGVMSYLVNRRIKEIGVLMALGADAGGVLRTVILQGLRPVIAGSVVGLFAAGALSALLHATLVFPGSIDLLYGLKWWDPLTFVGLTMFLAAVAAAASAAPARRALRVDPAVALRCE